MECKDMYRLSGPNRRDLIYNIHKMWEDLSEKESAIRFELRKNRGHKGKVSDKVLNWLDRADRIRSLVFDLPIQLDTQIDLLEVVNVFSIVEEIKVLQSVRQLLVFNDSNVSVQYTVRSDPDMSSQPIVGRSAQEASNKIWEYLLDPMVQTIGFQGEGGVGKTTIMKNISNQVADTEIFERVIWVTLSKYKSLISLQEDITALLIPTNLKDVKKSLFIFDSVWNPVDLTEIGIARLERGDGCKLILITRFQSVANSADKIINLVCLTMNEAWDLFVKRSGNQVLNPVRERIAQEIVYECRGLPSTVITLAYVMRGEVNIAVWSKVLKGLLSEEVTKRTSYLLRFCYNHLKNDRIRECFTYCVFFPENYKFEVKELIDYWMAENFLDTGADILTARNKGLDILKDLTDANMLELFMEGDSEWVRMPGVFRDLAMSIMAERFEFFSRAGRQLTKFPFNAGCTQAKKISLIGNLIEELHMHPRFFLLSTLLLKDNPLSDIPSSLFPKVPHLQVLDLSYSGITELPASLSGLAKLRALLLQYCTSLKKIPSIEDLKDLQILNLCGTLIKELPRGIERLNGLKSLDLSDTLLLESLQDGLISSLSNLEELHMRGSCLCKMETETVAKCFKEIRCLKKLVILTLSAVGFEDHLETIVHLQGYNLRSFSINIYGSTQDYAEDL